MTDRSRMVKTEQVRLLYENAALGLGVTVLAAAILTVIQWALISHAVLISWLTYMVILTLSRFALVHRYWSAAALPLQDSHWGTRYTIGVALSGLGWGLAGAFLFPEESPKHQVFLAFVLGGMMAGAATVLASMRAAFLVFIILTALPITARFFAHGDDVHIAMGTLSALFSVATLAAAWRGHTALVTSLNLRFENRDLIAYLSAAKRQTDSLNEELLFEITERKQTQRERERWIGQLQDALGKIKVLRGCLPICSHCKKIRDDKGQWHCVEDYVKERTEADFTHGICPECLYKLYVDADRNK